MAQSRSRQRGVVRVASSAILAGLYAVLGIAGVTGCSSEGEGGGEQLGSVQQAISCSNILPCPAGDDCFNYVCQISTCVAVPAQKDGEACKDTSSGQIGACTGTVCCLGCMRPNGLGGYECGAGDQLNECGQPGTRCEDCDKGDLCTSYVCSEKHLCDQAPVADKDPCTDDSGVCWRGGCCAGCLDRNDECQPGNTVNFCGRSTPQDGLVACDDCDDGNVCSNDPCTNGVCAAKTPKAGACNDGNACTGSDTCSGTTCGGTAVTCNDSKVCTDDSCDMATGCKYTPREAGKSCDDGNLCNGTSVCDGGTTCNPGTALDCDDSKVCTTDSCDGATGCKHVNNTNPCSDNNLCTIGDVCGNGSCKPGTSAPDCDDNNPCTVDSCDQAVGCKHVALPNGDGCDDGNACTTVDECQGGKCLGSGGPTCDDSNQCTKNTCSVATQACSNPDEPNDTPCTFDKCHVNSTCQGGDCTAGNPVDCNDNNPCTDDDCDPATGCTHVNNTDDCSDNNQCTSGDKCSGGACVGTPKVCAALDDCHEAGECDPADGTCDDPRADNGIDCQNSVGDDGSCTDGICVPFPEGGAGGEANAGGMGPSQGGSPTGEAGEPGVVGQGGDGATVPGQGGAPGTTGGKSGNGTGAATGEGGDGYVDDDDVPDHVFVRAPGGCSCSVPGSVNHNGGALGLATLALAAALLRRGRGSARRPTA